jgi:hypothetical protein
MSRVDAKRPRGRRVRAREGAGVDVLGDSIYRVRAEACGQNLAELSQKIALTVGATGPLSTMQ